jgi:hypothetical protein
MQSLLPHFAIRSSTAQDQLHLYFYRTCCEASARRQAHLIIHSEIDKRHETLPACLTEICVCVGGSFAHWPIQWM